MTNPNLINRLEVWASDLTKVSHILLDNYVMVDNNLNRLNQVFENLHTGSFCRNALLFEAVIRYQTIYASAEGNNTMAKQKDKDIRAIRNAMDKASQEKMAFHDDLRKKLRKNATISQPTDQESTSVLKENRY